MNENGSVGYLEVKPSAKVLESDFLQRFPFKQQRATELSCPLKLITERQIRIDPILGNLKLLHRYSGFQSFTPLHMQLLGLVKDFGRVSLARLSGSTGAPPGEVLATVLSLIARGLIHSDLAEHEMGFSTIVWMR